VVNAKNVLTSVTCLKIPDWQIRSADRQNGGGEVRTAKEGSDLRQQFPPRAAARSRTGHQGARTRPCAARQGQISSLATRLLRNLYRARGVIRSIANADECKDIQLRCVAAEALAKKSEKAFGSCQ